MNFRFIKAFWDILKEDFKKTADEFFANGSWPKGLNASFITLIPKSESPQGLKDFRPISLVNCVYKVMAKVLAIRMKEVMSYVIDDCQFAFVGNKNMLDSVPIANEVIHEAKRRKQATFVLKVDFEKAYDTISWQFLTYMLRRMKFGERWVRWIKGCLESSCVSVLVNGSPTEEFSMGRGIRQGDPLAPFLFLVVAEGLSGLLRQATLLGKFSPFEFRSEEKIEVSLLQFADDTVFFGRATMQNVFTVKCILRCFEMVSELKVNFFKSKVAGMPQGVATKCKSILLRFLWGGAEGGRKIAWVQWEKVCRPVNEGGLGVKDWNRFNWSLLGKWRWRMMKEEDSLWCRILSAKYNGRVRPSDSQWWKDINAVCFDQGHGCWFNNAICRRLGDGGKVAFWKENWLGCGDLKGKFPRIFALSDHKDRRIKEMGEWNNDIWQWKLLWNRDLLEREEERVQELLQLIKNFSPKKGIEDRWVWTKEGSGVYTVKSAYAFLHGSLLDEEKLVFKWIWSCKAPSNASSFVWRVLINRVQSKVELAKRNAFQGNVDLSCGMCGGDEKSSSHLFFTCPVAWKVWMDVYRWLGVVLSFPKTAEDQLMLHGSVLQGGKKSVRVLTLIWISTVGALWGARNGFVFKGKVVDGDRLIGNIQYKVWL
ncbi:uncharacterized protein LOC130744965 [Lotus japonicus]|uniref:uncharacterized protein LOC130744965 n=1 Tax=Lotus japonicus TaxID=34305 RepID=UPI002583828C|nr:uncharacterized protein LOC130744965 [Lotus japonicus]